MIDKDLDMNICTETPLEKKCFSCKKIHKTNHYVVAGDGLVMLCTNCLEKMAIRALEKCGYKDKFNNKILYRFNKRSDLIE